MRVLYSYRGMYHLGVSPNGASHGAVNMVRSVLLVVGIVVAACTCPAQDTLPPSSSERVSVLAELFTSEGCSSCPPADRLLESLDTQPMPGVEIIVLSEHVDYWNHDGWTDPYSSADFSERQRVYAKQLKLAEVYTPQLVIDGRRQMSGNNVKEAESALRDSRTLPKTELHITHTTADPGRLRVEIESAAATLPGVHALDVYLVLALNHAESQVTRGENANRHLTHTAVVRKIKRVGKVVSGRPFSQNVELKIDAQTNPHDLRLVAFLQDADSGRVFGATMKHVE
jgi:hypothetical protein